MLPPSPQRWTIDCPGRTASPDERGAHGPYSAGALVVSVPASVSDSDALDEPLNARIASGRSVP
ncbi:hypothetical protein GCM10012282_22040 [Streptomyces lacrimifluminis]|uniref:Uncharacterized protein n=1 Tax=Streptomyces lacrimifluminis TaxID=1500077 RepID=A0A917KT05_9ACTN|nr:hypothetical protein GCM10012282_22040 [Streptomyces lacrimifluminis]